MRKRRCRTPETYDEQRHSPESCAMCERVTKLTFHHLIPKSQHRRLRAKKVCHRAELCSGIRICRPCHDALHRLYDEKTLAVCYPTFDSIVADANVQKHIKWVKKQRVTVPALELRRYRRHD